MMSIYNIFKYINIVKNKKIIIIDTLFRDKIFLSLHLHISLN